jgi:hypothetical protein
MLVKRLNNISELKNEQALAPDYYSPDASATPQEQVQVLF